MIQKITNFIYRSAPPRLYTFLSLACLILLFSFVAHAQEGDCTDIHLVFARGSSDNPQALYLNEPFGNRFKSVENMSGAFFQSFEDILTRDYPNITLSAQSVHNYSDLYNQNGYRAVGIFGPKTINNIFDAELSWWPLGEYRTSVSDGTEELSGYLKDQIKKCPGQIIVLGGYSQGAHVAGEALFKLNPEERNAIDAVALFGDPKYIGSDSNNRTPFDYLGGVFEKPKAKPWKRGTASLIDRGVLDPRLPYVPAELEDNTLSWCFNDDFVCSGGSGITKSLRPLVAQQTSTLNKETLGEGHKRYDYRGIPEAAKEITQRLFQKLRTLEVSRGGIDLNGPYKESYTKHVNDKKMDIMFMYNTSYNINDVLGQIRINSKQLFLTLFSYYKGGIRYGVGEFAETGTTTNRVPRIAIWKQPSTDTGALIYTYNTKLIYGNLSGGGVDTPDPHIMGIERGIRGTQWDEEAEKHLVVVTERPMLSEFTYNICASDVRSGFNITIPNSCLTDPALETDTSYAHSERCETIRQVLTSSVCALYPPVRIPWKITRTEQDLEDLILASDVAVTFVIPHQFRYPEYYDKTKKQFEYLSQISGGLFLQYTNETMTYPDYTDMMWRIVNHIPDRAYLNHIQNFDTAGSVFSTSKNNQQLQLYTNTPQLFTITTNRQYDQYKWDIDGDGVYDETTFTPQLETVYERPLSGNSYLTVTASAPGLTDRTVRIPVEVVDSGQVTKGMPPSNPILSLERDKTNALAINYSCDKDSILFLDFDLDGMPDVTTTCNANKINVYISTADNMKYWAENYYGKSSVQEIVIPPVITEEDYSDDTNVEYKEEVKSITDIMTSNIQQSTTSGGEVNTRTYNPQQTKPSEVKTTNKLQKTQTLSESALAVEFDTVAPSKTFTTSDGVYSLALFVIFPLIVLLGQLYRKAKR